ncbi:MAG: tetratricopeptide repeat protein [Sinobacteraceae bacterium]|nr:tetratricopeptide repeat protein [Nevskiaceae bacterium]
MPAPDKRPRCSGGGSLIVPITMRPRSTVRFGAACLASALLAAAALAQAPSSQGPVSQGEEATTAAPRDCRSVAEAEAKAASLDRDPRNAVRAVEIARACHHHPAAWQAAERLRELDPENVEALRLVGSVALEAWRIDAARQVYAELLAKPDVEPERALAELLPELAEGDTMVGAWAVFKSLLDRSSLSARHLMTLARIACDVDDLAACRELIDAARAKGGGNDARSIRLSAATSAALGDEPRALEEASLLVQGDPQNHRFARIETLVSLDRLDEARQELLAIEAGTADPDASAQQRDQFKAEADRRLALLALGSGDAAEAERRFTARLSADRGAGEAVYYLAIIAEREGRKDVALQGYQRLVRAGAGLPARARAAHLLLETGDRAAAMKLFDDLLGQARTDAIEIELARSRALASASLPEEALAAVDAALQRFPSHPELLYQRAVLLDSSGRSREGIAVFEQLLVMRPGDPNISNALGYTMADRKRQLPRAEALIREALVLRPDNAAFLDSLGWARYRRGDRASALPVLERAWRLSREPEIAAHWGEVLWRNGERDRARAVWARALLLAPDSKPLRETIERFADRRR